MSFPLLSAEEEEEEKEDEEEEEAPAGLLFRKLGDGGPASSHATWMNSAKWCLRIPLSHRLFIKKIIWILFAGEKEPSHANVAKTRKEWNNDMGRGVKHGLAEWIATHFLIPQIEKG